MVCIIPIVFLISCKRTPQEISDIDIKNAITVFMDTKASQGNDNGNYIVFPEFNMELSNNDFINLTEDTVFTAENIDYIKNQYYQLKKRSIKEFFPEKYYSKFNPDRPKPGQWCYSMDPPLFTIDKKHFIIYSKGYFWVKDEIRWDDLYFVYIKQGENWKFQRYIKSKK